MKKSELLKLIEGVSEEQDINSLLVDTDVFETFKECLNVDMFKDKLKNDKEFKNYINSINDNHFNTAIRTMKEKGTWEGEFSDVIKEKYPDLIIDPTQKELMELKKQLADERAANARKDLLNQVMKHYKDTNLPASVIEKCLEEDFDKTKEVIDSIAEDWSNGLETIATEKMKQSSYVPGKGSDGKPMSIGASIAAQNNSKSNAPSNPWGDK